MRLDNSIINFIKQAIKADVPEAKIYLFGSRTNDDALGGDIDLMILSKNQIDKKLFRAIRVEFFKKFGWQKIDIVNFTFDDQTTFRQLIHTNAIEL